MSYGFCPICGWASIYRERRPNGNDRCQNSHEYPSASATKDPRPTGWQDKVIETRKKPYTLSNEAKTALGTIAEMLGMKPIAPPPMTDQDFLDVLMPKGYTAAVLSERLLMKMRLVVDARDKQWKQFYENSTTK